MYIHTSLNLCLCVVSYEFPDAATPNPIIGFAPVFNLPSQSRDTDPPEFTLSFSVIRAPPTYVICQVGSTPVDVAVLSREVTSGEYLPPSTASPVTNVIVSLRTRQAGNYQCIVFVIRASRTDTTNDLTDVTSATVSVTG